MRLFMVSLDSIQDWAVKVRLLGAKLDVCDEEMDQITAEGFHEIDDLRTHSVNTGVKLGVVASKICDWRTFVKTHIDHATNDEYVALQRLNELIENQWKRVNDLLEKVGIGITPV